MPRTQMTNRPTRLSEVAVPTERSVQDLIARARAAAPPSRGAWLLSLLTGLLTWAAFTPLDWGPLGWICLVPVLQLVRIPRKTAWMYTALYVCGFLTWLATLQWMRLGDATMYTAWLALTIYLACYWPMFVWLSRVAVHRLGVPLMLAAPLVWTGLEYFRAHLITGFPWYFLGHTQHHWAELIQISDLVGAYGVSFILVMTAACLAELVPTEWLRRMRLLGAGEPETPAGAAVSERWQILGVVCCSVIVASTLVYGFVRRSQAYFRGGPRVALVQGNFPASVKHDQAEWQQMFRVHRYLTGQTIPEQPDLVVWPETMFRWPLFSHEPGMTDDELKGVHPQVSLEAWKSKEVQAELANMADETNAALIIGVDAYEGSTQGLDHYNSAVFVKPLEGISARYDKLHRVPFGEYIPLREQFPWLHRFTPYGDDFGITRGESIHVFNDHAWRYVPLICFEDTVPHLVRQMVAAGESDDQEIDCLVNLTNDGWFHGSSELDQHLITARFRCIETRTPMVRAVNTGISAIIDGDGLIVDPDVFIDLDGLTNGNPRTSIRDPRTGRLYKQLSCAQVGDVPLDDRVSVYVMLGDWFAGLCAVTCLCLLALGLFLKPIPAVDTASSLGA